MMHKFLSMFHFETRRLIWILGTMFAVVIALQYFELPYGNVVSLFSFGKDLGAAKNSSQSVDTSKFEDTSKVIALNAANSTSTYAEHEIPNITDNLDDALAPEEAREPVASIFVQKNSSGDSGVPNTKGNLYEASAPEEAREPEPSVFVRKSNTMDNTRTYADHEIPTTKDILDNASAPDKARQPQPSFVQINNTTDTALVDNGGRLENVSASPSPTLAPTILPIVNSEANMDTNSGALVLSAGSNTSSVNKDVTPAVDNSGNSGQMQKDLISMGSDSSLTSVPEMQKEPNIPSSAVISISEMNNLLLQSQASYHPMKPRWSSAVDHELLHAKSLIDNAPIIQNDPILYAPIYRNFSMFKRSYELMEEMLKVYIYKEGQRPIFHQAVLKGIYASEGWFLKLLEANRKFVTKDPRKAQLFYLPFSSRMLEEVLYVPDSHSHKNLIQYLKNYLDMIIVKHPFWNRTGGADHFLVACHDWAPSETKQYMSKCIRALCNADVKEGFVFGKDVSLPETYVRSAQNLLKDLGGQPPSKRSTLAFFAGSMHGYLRPILLQHWGNNKDPDMKIFGRMPNGKKGKSNYIQYMRSSKYCICAKGYEVNSPRVVEAIFYECVPVIISDNFVPPFFEVLDWESFAVFVLEKDIPNLKNILLAIPEKRLRQMQLRVKKVQQHFLWHAKPVKYDIFHMILHSVWYNRLFQLTPI